MLPDQAERTRVALEYFKALRTETIERLKMRDRILLGYLGASGALIGYSQEHHDFISPLLLLIPFLALGAATIIAQHQDQIVAFNQYISRELAKDLPDPANPVVSFNASEAGIHHLEHNLRMNLVAQLILLCGPPVFVLWINWPYLRPEAPLKDIYGMLGSLFTLITIGRIWFSRHYRHSVMSKLGPPRKSMAAGHHSR